jgi:hypothetical protein
MLGALHFYLQILGFSSYIAYSMKPGRIVILLAGRHAGKKAIIVKQHDDGKKVSLSLSPF